MRGYPVECQIEIFVIEPEIHVTEFKIQSCFRIQFKEGPGFLITSPVFRTEAVESAYSKIQAKAQVGIEPENMKSVTKGGGHCMSFFPKLVVGLIVLFNKYAFCRGPEPVIKFKSKSRIQLLNSGSESKVVIVQIKIYIQSEKQGPENGLESFSELVVLQPFRGTFTVTQPGDSIGIGFYKIGILFLPCLMFGFVIFFEKFYSYHIFH